MYNSIRPGKVWLDTSGKPIQAHGFSVFWNEPEKLWYWYGENKEFTKKGGTTWTYGIRYYTSPDLYNWTDRGLLIPPSNDLNEPLHPTYCIDRPHIIFCGKTGKFVCWIKVMASEVAQFMIVMQTGSITHSRCIAAISAFLSCQARKYLRWRQCLLQNRIRNEPKRAENEMLSFSARLYPSGPYSLAGTGVVTHWKPETRERNIGILHPSKSPPQSLGISGSKCL